MQRNKFAYRRNITIIFETSKLKKNFARELVVYESNRNPSCILSNESRFDLKLNVLNWCSERLKQKRNETREKLNADNWLNK